MNRDGAQDNSKPLVLHVIDSLDISGGAEKQLVANLRHFDRGLLAHEVAVIKQTAETRANEIGDLAPIHQLVQENSPPSRRLVISGLRHLVRSRRPSLIHASLPDSALATRVVAGLEGTGAIESLVNISHEGVRTIDNPGVTRPKLIAHTLLDRLTMRTLTGFHAVSQAVADSWVKTAGLDPNKIEIIPRGVELHKGREIQPEESRRDAKEAVYAEFGLDPESPLVLSVGRVEAQKGHRYLVEAMAEVVKDHPSVRLLLVGRKGNAAAAVERTIQELGLQDIVSLIGARRDLPRLLAAADIFAFPSLFEGNGGNAMIEAMAAGLPIITTGHPPMTDLIPNNDFGILVERCDSKSLASSIRLLVDDAPLRSRLAKAARTRAETFASPREIAARHEKWYQRLLAR